jgi:hypothetical protein
MTGGLDMSVPVIGGLEEEDLDVLTKITNVSDTCIRFLLLADSISLCAIRQCMLTKTKAGVKS